jgi:DNA-binding GntR family transcriptional regulator
MPGGESVRAIKSRKRDETLTILEHPQPPMSAGDSGYHRIRSDIIFGVLTPSGRLKLDSMKEDYGLSVSTLREILNRLASEGFVVAEGQR